MQFIYVADGVTLVYNTVFFFLNVHKSHCQVSGSCSDARQTQDDAFICVRFHLAIPSARHLSLDVHDCMKNWQPQCETKQLCIVAL